MSDANVAESESSRSRPASPGRRAWRRFRHNRPAVISSWFLAVLLLVVLGWPALLAVAGHAGTAGKAFAEQHDPDTLSENQFQLESHYSLG